MILSFQELLRKEPRRYPNALGIYARPTRMGDQLYGGEENTFCMDILSK
jgi:hypothetical protein